MADVGERFGYDDAAMAEDLLTTRMRERGMEPDDVEEMVILGSGLGHWSWDHLSEGIVVNSC